MLPLVPLQPCDKMELHLGANILPLPAVNFYPMILVLGELGSQG